MDIAKACDRLNEVISEKKEGFLDVVNLIMNQIYQEGYEMFWDREIFIDCNGEDKKMRDLVRYSDKVMFESSDDPDEHPGVVVRYKRLHKFDIGDKFRLKNTRGYTWWEIIGIEYGSIEPVYTLESRPIGERYIAYGEAALDELYHKL